MKDLNRKISPALAAEILIAMLLLVWRICEILRGGRFPEAPVLLIAYWLFSIVATGRRAWVPVTLAAIAALLLVYAWGEVPQALATLGLSR